jgi:DNA-binding SARP family transcriptional activator
LVQVDGREAPPDVLWRKHLALLTYLALSPDRTRSRGHLLGLLWPESPEDKARRSLNEAVRRLRAALGTERLLTHGDALQLNATQLDVDARQFETLRAEGQLRALELLRGEFLEGFHVDDAAAFED